MKNKLKTLNDIEIKAAAPPVAYIEDLREEAVKWVKQWRNLRFLNEFPSPKLPVSMKEQADEIFMNFFNLTEEDLK